MPAWLGKQATSYVGANSQFFLFFLFFRYAATCKNHNMFSLFNKFVSSDPKVRNHPLLVGPTHTNRNWEDTSTPPCFISSHSGHIRYRNSNRVHMMTSRYPLPVHTRVLHWRASLPRRFFLATSFSTQVGGLVSKLPSASVKSLSIIGRGRRPSLLQWKGGNHRFTAAPLQLPFAQHDHERRQIIA